MAALTKPFQVGPLLLGTFYRIWGESSSPLDGSLERITEFYFRQVAKLRSDRSDRLASECEGSEQEFLSSFENDRPGLLPLLYRFVFLFVCFA